MALVDSVLPIDFGQGVDTKTDPKLVVKGKLLSLQNGIFTNTKRITKRNGYTALNLGISGGGTITNPTMARSYKNELVCAGTATGASITGQRLFSYSPSLSKWVDRGKYNSIAVSKMDISSQDAASSTGVYGMTSPSCAVSGNYLLSVSNLINGSDNYTLVVVVDLSTNTQIFNQAIDQGSNAKAVLLGASQLSVFYVDNLGRYNFRLVTISGGSVSLTGGAAIASATGVYDVATTPTGCVFAYSTSVSTSLFIQNMNTSGTVTASTSIASATTTNGKITPIGLSIDASNNVWAYWADNSTVTSEPLYYAILPQGLGAPVLVKTTIDTGIRHMSQVTAYSTDSTHQQLYFSHTAVPFGGSDYASVYTVKLSSVGVVGSRSTYISNADICSKVVSFNSTNYLCAVSISDSSPTGFLVDLQDTNASAVAKFLDGKAEALQLFNVSVFVGTRFSSGIVAPSVYGNTLLLGAAFSVQAGIVAQPNLSPSEIAYYVNYGSTVIGFDFANQDANKSLIFQDTLILNGGIVQQYDGFQVTEVGFNTFPTLLEFSTSGSSGVMGAGNFTYYVVFEWQDALGNLQQSAPSLACTQTFNSGTTNKVQVYIPAMPLTQKNNFINSVITSVYKTIANGVEPFLLGQIAGNGGTFTDDTVTDANLMNNPPLYTYASGVVGGIIDNLPPPPSMVLWEYNNRVWAIHSEYPSTNINYCKTASIGTGVSFGGDFLQVVIDSKGGAMTGGIGMDEKIVILKKNALGFFIGDGANDTGAGSTITPFQFIPAQTGCSNSKSIILSDAGIIFRSSNNKGIYSLSRGLQAEYIGYEVEAYNSQDITSAVSVPDKTQIRFLTSSGSSLLYDYVMNQWSTFTNHAGLSADSFQGLYTYVRADGSIYQESQTSFQDNGTDYQLVAQTAWLDLSSVQNFERVRWVLMLGDYANGTSASHGMQIQAAYNFSSSFSTAVAKTFGAASSSGVFQYRNFFSTQKCDSLSLLITEITTGNVNESLDLTNMTLVAALKKGSYKLGAAASVG